MHKNEMQKLNLGRLAGMPILELYAELKTSQRGLKSDEARERLKIYGTNTIPENRFEALKIFLGEIISPFNLILLVATAISWVFNSPMEAVMIFVFFAVSTGLTFFEVYHANQAAAALKKYLVHRVEVMREGKLTIVSSEEVVPGDVLSLGIGDKLPADARILVSDGLLLDESNLTGESRPIDKSAAGIMNNELRIKAQATLPNVLYAGSAVVEGHAEALIVATGKRKTTGSRNS